MTRIPGKAHLLSTAFGLAMAVTAGVHTSGVASIIAVACALVVGVGMGLRLAAMFAVLLAATAVMLADLPPLQAGLVGLCGAYYLILRHTERRFLGEAGWVVIVAAAGFAVAAVLVGSLPLDLPWLPMLAAPATFVAYLVALQPFLPSTATTRGSKRNSLT
jgi:hypothetical protein